MSSALQLAAGVTAAVQAAMGGIGASAGALAGATMGKVRGSDFSSLRAAVEHAIAQDEKEATSFWIELGEVLEHGLGYWGKKQAFDNEVASLTTLVHARLTAIENLLAKVDAKAGHVPAELDASAKAWAEAESTLTQTRSGVDAVRAIPGWAGRAANAYQDVNVVQSSATGELGGITSSVSAALSAIAVFNRALFEDMGQAVRAAASAVRSAPGGAGSVYYLRTSKAAHILGSLEANLNRSAAGQPVAAAASELSSQIDSTLHAPALLAPGGWPTGGSQAAVAPGDTAGVTPLDDDADVAEGGGGSGDACVPGVTR